MRKPHSVVWIESFLYICSPLRECVGRLNLFDKPARHIMKIDTCYEDPYHRF